MSLQGCLLVASPQLLDPNFVQTVVLVIQHSEEGALGVVLNRWIPKTIQELWEEAQEPPCQNQQHVNIGGPVSGPLMAVHSCEDLGEIEVRPGLYFCAEKTHLEELVSQGEHRCKLFVGHSGWAEGQLEAEIREGAWPVTPATLDFVFLDEDQLWKRVTRHIG